MSNRTIKIIPNEKRNYKKLVEIFLEKIKSVEIENIYNEVLKENIMESKDEGIILIIKTLLKLLKNQHMRLSLKKESEDIFDILRLLRIIIIDLEDYQNAYKVFKGIQLFSVQRSIFDHLTIYLLLLLDGETKDFYFRGYNNEEEKKYRFNKLFKVAKIKKKLKKVLENIEETNGLDCSWLTKNIKVLVLSPDFKNIYDRYSELNHLNEIELTRKYYKDEIELKEVSNKIMDKEIDEYLFFLIGLITTIYILNESIYNAYLENDHIVIDCKDNQLVTFLFKILEEIQNYRFMDKVLIELKSEAKKIYEME